MTTLRCTALAVALLAGLPAVANAQCEPRFIVDSAQGYGFTPYIFGSGESGFSLVSHSEQWDPDGDGPEPAWLVVAGRFTRAANVNSVSIVAWDGSQWRGFGRGLPTTPRETPPTVFDARSVIAVGTFQGQLIVNDGSLKRWNGDGWTDVISFDRHPFFTGVSSTDIIEHQGSLYIGGLTSFFNLQNQTVSRPLAARVVGDSLERLGPALSASQNAARKFLSRPEGLYAAGTFTSLADGTVLNNVALWNGTSWSSVGGGVNGVCEDAAFINDQLYVVGSFTQAGGQPVQAVARYDGTQWHPVGDGSLTSATSIINIDGTIYVSGRTATNLGIYRLDGASWTWLQGGFVPLRLSQMDGELIAMGNTSTGLDQGVQFPAEDAIRLTADGWKALGAPNDYTGGFGVVYQGRLIAQLGRSRDRFQDRYAEWDGTTWRTFEIAADFSPRLSSTGNRLFGFRRTSNNPLAERTYEYSAGTWRDWESTIGFTSGLPNFGPVEYFGEMYLYGRFTSLNGQPVQGLLRASGESWVPVALPTQTALINSAAVHDGLLYLSGEFIDESGQTTTLATFDGVNLTTYATGLTGVYWGLVSDGTSLFAASGMQIDRWNGSSFDPYWSAPEGAVSFGVFVANHELMAIVSFPGFPDFADIGANYLARRSDTGGTQLISEPFGTRFGDQSINGTYAFPVVYGSEIHFFGDFNQIGAANLPGNRVVNNWTRFTTNGVPLIVTQPADVVTSCGAPVELRAVVANGYDADGSLEYQWCLNGNALSETQFTRGVDTDTLTIPSLAQPFTGIYTLSVTNSCGTTTSREAFVTGDTPDCRACAPCSADFDFDGGVTGDDVAAFFAAYEINAPCADVDASGGVDGSDLAVFFTLYEAGGC